MLMLMVTQKKVAVNRNNLSNLDIGKLLLMLLMMSKDDDYEFSSDILKLYLSTLDFLKSKGRKRYSRLQDV